MEAFETTLTGSDGAIAGIVTQLSKEAYQFTSFDDALHLTIAKDEHGKWTRLSGSEPYFSGWVDELVEKVAMQPKTVKATSPNKTTVAAKKAAGTLVKKTVKGAAVKTTIPTKVVPAKKTTAAPVVKKTTSKSNLDKKTTATVSASKKAKVSSASAKGK